ncbi:MAG: hypothetical protein ACOC4I_03795 [Spirochaetota bacterium]
MRSRDHGPTGHRQNRIGEQTPGTCRSKHHIRQTQACRATGTRENERVGFEGEAVLAQRGHRLGVPVDANQAAGQRFNHSSHGITTREPASRGISEGFLLYYKAMTQAMEGV